MTPTPPYSPVSGVGIDLVDISRIRTILNENKDHFMDNTFSEEEVRYCTSFTDPAPHFAGTFAAKEAYRKATGLFDKKFSEIEIRRTSAGRPEIWIENTRDTSLHISISHTDRDATAIAIKSS